MAEPATSARRQTPPLQQPAEEHVNKAASIEQLSGLSYKELQSVAMVMNIPANLKTSRLLEVIEARRAGDEARVERLLSEYREQRRLSLVGHATARPAAGGASVGGKRRRVQGAARMRDFFHSQLPSASRAEDAEESYEANGSQEKAWSGVPQKHTQIQNRSPTAQERTDHQKQELVQQAQQILQSDSEVCNRVSPVQTFTEDAYFETKHNILQETSWSSDSQESKPSPDSGFMSPSTFSTEEDSETVCWSVNIVPPGLVNPVYSQARMQEAGQHQTPPQISAEERMSSRPLEMLWNVHTDVQLVPSLAMTQPSFCYRRPISSAVHTSITDTKLLPQPSIHYPTTHQPSHGPSYGWLQGNRNFIEPVPNFRQNDQISFPLIYSYLASTEEQLQQNQQNHVNQHQFHHPRQNFHMPVAEVSQLPVPSNGEEQWHMDSTEADGQWTPSEGANTPFEPEIPHLVGDLTLALMNVQADVPVTSSDTQQVTKSEHVTSSHSTATTSTASSTTSTIATKYPIDTGSTSNSVSSHTTQSASEEQLKTNFQEDTLHCVSCPQQECSWTGRLRSLASHLRQRHKETITSATETSHTVTLAELQAQQHVYFLQEAGRRLFIVAAHFHGTLMHITVQSIPSGRAGVARGALEVVASDGKPRSWRGRVRGYHEPLASLWARKHCLTVDPTALGSSSSITLYCSISLHAPLALSGTQNKVTEKDSDVIPQNNNELPCETEELKE